MGTSIKEMQKELEDKTKRIADEQEEKEEIQRRNHAAIAKIYQILNDTKGFEVAMNSPYKGKILVSFNGHLCLLELDQLLPADGKDFDEQFKQYQFLLK